MLFALAFVENNIKKKILRSAQYDNAANLYYDCHSERSEESVKNTPLSSID